MKFKTIDGIHSVIASAKIGDIDKVSKLLYLSDRIIKARDGIAEEYSKIVQENLEVKKDDQGTPIIEKGVEVKFLSNEGREKINELNIDVELTDEEKSLVQECISDVIANVSGGEPNGVLNLKKKLVELYKSF